MVLGCHGKVQVDTMRAMSCLRVDMYRLSVIGPRATPKHLTPGTGFGFRVSELPQGVGFGFRTSRNGWVLGFGFWGPPEAKFWSLN